MVFKWRMAMDAVEFAIATRTNAAMSQKAMAARMGVTERQIRNWEKRVAPIPKLAFEEYQRIEAETNGR